MEYMLRPLQQPLFDTEWVTPKTAGEPVSFFTGNVPPALMRNGREKTAFETNLESNQGGLLDPLEFSLFGFCFDFHGISEADRRLLLADSLFQFCYTGHRVYLTIPTQCIPSIDKQKLQLLTSVPIGQLLEKKKDVVLLADGEQEFRSYLERLQQKAPDSIYRFTVGRAALRFKPTENFCCEISWRPGSRPVVPEAGVKITCYLIGILWRPL